MGPADVELVGDGAAAVGNVPALAGGAVAGAELVEGGDEPGPAQEVRKATAVAITTSQDGRIRVPPTMIGRRLNVGLILKASRLNRRESRVKYVVVYEQAPRNSAAYVPDLPGCVATGKTRAATRKLIREAIQMHIGAMRQAGEPIPDPGSTVEPGEV